MSITQNMYILIYLMNELI